LISKARGYQLSQVKQLDTFEAYDALGLKDDMREFSGAVKILKLLGLSSVRLLSNNPNKVSSLEDGGIEVVRVALIMSASKHAQGYLDAKKQQGHLL